MKNFVKFAAVTLSAAAALLTGVANKVAHADGAAPTAAMTAAVADVNVPASGEAVDVTRANPQGNYGVTKIKWNGTTARIYLNKKDAKFAIGSGLSIGGIVLGPASIAAAIGLAVGGQAVSSYLDSGIWFDYSPTKAIFSGNPAYGVVRAGLQ